MENLKKLFGYRKNIIEVNVFAYYKIPLTQLYLFQ